MLVALLLAACQDPAEEEETRASAHLRMGAFFEKDPDFLADAHYHFERVIDFCPQATPEERLEARRRLHRLHGRVPANGDEKRAAVLRVMVYVWRNVNWKSARYRTSENSARAIKRGFDAFARTVWETTRGALRVEAQFVAPEDEVRNLSVNNEGTWMAFDDLEKNGQRRLKDAEVDLVFSYVVSGGGLAFEKSLRGGPNRGMLYSNFLWTDAEAESNSVWGLQEFRVFMGFAVDALRRRGGYRDNVLNADPKNDPCSDAQGDPDLWLRHYAEDHVTSLMWREIGRPQAPYLRVWYLSPRFNHADERTFAQEFVPETNPEVDVRAWEQLRSPTDVIDLAAQAKGNPRAVFYAATYVYSKKRQWVKLYLGEDDCAKVFLNGQLLHGEFGNRGVEADRLCLRLPLKEGRNFLLLKIANNAGPGGFCARITDFAGQPAKIEITLVRK